MAARDATHMQRLKWAKVRVSGQSRNWYGCVFIASVLRPAFIQLDPNSAGYSPQHLFYNHFMRGGACSGTGGLRSGPGM